MSNPSKESDDACAITIRDVLTDALSKFTPTVRAAMLEQVNAAMTHLCARLDVLQGIEAEAAKQEKDRDHA